MVVQFNRSSVCIYYMKNDKKVSTDTLKQKIQFNSSTAGLFGYRFSCSCLEIFLPLISDLISTNNLFVSNAVLYLPSLN